MKTIVYLIPVIAGIFFLALGMYWWVLGCVGLEVLLILLIETGCAKAMGGLISEIDLGDFG